MWGEGKQWVGSETQGEMYTRPLGEVSENKCYDRRHRQWGMKQHRAEVCRTSERMRYVELHTRRKGMVPQCRVILKGLSFYSNYKGRTGKIACSIPEITASEDRQGDCEFQVRLSYTENSG